METIIPSIIACLFSYFLIVRGINKKKKAKNILNSGVKTNAKIIGFNEDNGSPLIEFENQKNKWVTFELAFSSNSDELNIGDIIKISYFLNEEGYYIVVDRNGWRNRDGNILFIGGIIFFCISFLHFLNELGLINIEFFRKVNELFGTQTLCP